MSLSIQINTFIERFAMFAYYIRMKKERVFSWFNWTMPNQIWKVWCEKIKK